MISAADFICQDFKKELASSMSMKGNIFLYAAIQPYEENDENVIAGFVQDETDENRFIYVSKELNVEYDTLFADSIEDAKHQIEEMLIDHWNDEIDYLENRIKSFRDGE